MGRENHIAIIDVPHTHAPATDEPVGIEPVRKGPGRPRRAIPDDFEEKFAESGYGQELKDHYGIHTYTLKRWIAEYGGDKLKLARLRKRWAGWEIGKRSRRKNYQVGRRLGS